MVPQLRKWTANIRELLDKLKRTNPEEGMLGEIAYWKDMARILDALENELKAEQQ